MVFFFGNCSWNDTQGSWNVSQQDRWQHHLSHWQVPDACCVSYKVLNWFNDWHVFRRIYLRRRWGITVFVKTSNKTQQGLKIELTIFTQVLGYCVAWKFMKFVFNFKMRCIFGSAPREEIKVDVFLSDLLLIKEKPESRLWFFSIPFDHLAIVWLK